MHSDSRLAYEGANVISAAWSDLFDRFQIVTRRARYRFVERDWQGIATDHVQRLDLYSEFVTRAERDIRSLLGDRLKSRDVWIGMRAVYSGVVHRGDTWELAETFFNSITRRIFTTVGVDPRIEFVASDYDSPPIGPTRGLTNRFDTGTTGTKVQNVIDLSGLSGLFADLEVDVERVASRLDHRADQLGTDAVTSIEMLATVFYRGSSAYLVGSMTCGTKSTPMALALVHEQSGVAVDAVLTTENELSVLFSFTRSYFHVAVSQPHDMVSYLAELMPRKRRAELFIALGFSKHGKTELFREIRGHLDTSDDRFELAAGVPGLVMVVFTLPGFDVVFKIIRDRFGEPKRITRDRVLNRYRLVFRHDRAGRLIDAQEYEHLSFPVERFDPELLDVLLDACGRTVKVEDGTVTIGHSYVERRVTPLDIYIDHFAGSAAADAAIIDYGQAIRDLAASGIFPGDLLLKNFGVTRHGRVVFYDYDELTTLDECTFRYLPVSDDPLDEIAGQPWFSVGPHDVFPEEFSRFLGLSPHLLALLEAKHNAIFDAAAWKEWQRCVADGERIEVFPYTNEQRVAAKV